MKQGYIALHRQIQENEIWLSEKFTRGQAWVDMLMLANHKDGCIRVRGNRVDVKRGQLGWSIIRLSRRWGWSRGKVIRFLNELESDGQIVQQKSRVSSLITIVNYERYQSGSTTGGTQTVQQAAHRQNTNNNVNNVNNVNKKTKGRFVKPTIDEIRTYITEKGLPVNPEHFFDYYESIGWKVSKNPMKDWKATIRGWGRREKRGGQHSQNKSLSAIDRVRLANKTAENADSGKIIEGERVYD